MLRCSKTKGHPYGCPFVSGPAAQRRLHPSVFDRLGGSGFRLRQGFACGKTLERRKSGAAPKGRWGGFLRTRLKLKISILAGRPSPPVPAAVSGGVDFSAAFRYAFAILIQRGRRVCRTSLPCSQTRWPSSPSGRSSPPLPRC